MRVIVSGGGTGGHIYPALALIQRLQERHLLDAVLYVGTPNGLEADIVKKAGLPFKSLQLQGFRRKLTLDNFKTLWLFQKSLHQAKSILKDFAPDIVIGTGGYVAGSIVYEAARMHIPTIIHEQNSIAGVTNKFLAHVVDKIALVFPEAKGQFSEKKKIVITGNPRAQLVAALEPDHHLQAMGFNQELETLLVVGGSRGAKPINEAMLAAIPQFNDKPYQVLFVTGRAQYDQVVGQLTVPLQKNIKIVPYLDNMSDLLPEVSAFCGRSGATTLAELTALGIPSILIPSPYVTHNHQRHNADYLVQNSAAVLLEELELNGRSLEAAADHILLSKDIQRDMHEASLKLGTPTAADQVIKVMLELVRKH